MDYNEWYTSKYSNQENNPYAFADVGGGLGIGVGPQNIIAPADRVALMNFDRDMNSSLFMSFIDRTYTNTAGEEVSVVPLFLDVAHAGSEEDRIEANTALILALKGDVDIDGNVISGADWYDEYIQAAEATMQRNMGGGGSSGPTTQQQIDTAYAVIRDRALQMGLTYTDDEIIDVATLAINDNWNDTQVVDKLLTNYKYGEITDGTISDLRDQVITMHKQFLLDVSEDDAMKMAKRIALGELDADGLLSATRRQAKAQYAWAEPFIDESMTLLEAIAPQRTALANELELDPQEIDLSNSQFFDSLFQTDDKGVQRLATSTEIKRTARQLPQWEQTDNARTLMNQLTSSLTGIFGTRGF